MAFGLDDLENWIRNLVDSGTNAINVVNGDAPLTNIQSVNQNVKQGIIDPGKMLSEFSGLAQGYRGAKPNSSTMDKGLALLALTGYLSGGAANSLAKDPRVYAKGPSVLSKLKGVFAPEYAYGIHVSPTSGLNKIKPGTKVGIGNGGNFGDADNGMAYFFKSGNDKELTQMQEAVNNYLGRLSAGTGNGATAYSVRTPLKYTSVDENMGRFATKTPKNLKVINSQQLSPMDVIHDFTGGKAPRLPDNRNNLMQSLASLIQDNPKYSTRYTPSIFKPFEEKMNQKLISETSQWNQWKNRPKPKMVEVKPKTK
jgi:hypothetical protein